MKSIVVYCGSKDNVDEVYLNSAQRKWWKITTEESLQSYIQQEFGECMVKEGLSLVYGSCKTGLMGRVSKAVHEGGGKVTGITPKLFTKKFEEDHLHGYGETLFTDSMHERKAKMAEIGDAFVALPGGYGTMEELLEIITWYTLGLHKKPIGVLNLNGFYDKMLEWINHANSEGFLYEEALDVLISDSDPKKLIDKLIARAESLSKKQSS